MIPEVLKFCLMGKMISQISGHGGIEEAGYEAGYKEAFVKECNRHREFLAHLLYKIITIKLKCNRQTEFLNNLINAFTKELEAYDDGIDEVCSQVNSINVPDVEELSSNRWLGGIVTNPIDIFRKEQLYEKGKNAGKENGRKDALMIFEKNRKELENKLDAIIKEYGPKIDELKQILNDAVMELNKKYKNQQLNIADIKRMSRIFEAVEEYRSENEVLSDSEIKMKYISLFKEYLNGDMESKYEFIKFCITNKEALARLKLPNFI